LGIVQDFFFFFYFFKKQIDQHFFFLFCCSNQKGQLGLGDYQNQNRPKPIVGNRIEEKHFVSIYAGYRHVLAITGNQIFFFCIMMQDEKFNV
jgi:alpha-tubulin suppressor-like RCC1 family protein